MGRRLPSPAFVVARHVSARPRAVPLLAIAASVLWLVSQKPGPWGMVLAVAVTAVLGTRTLGWVERRTVALALGVLVASVDYFTWRFSVVNLSALWISVPLVIAELFGAVHVLGLQYTIWPRREAPLEADSAIPTRSRSSFSSRRSTKESRFCSRRSRASSRRQRATAPQTQKPGSRSSSATTGSSPARRRPAPSRIYASGSASSASHVRPRAARRPATSSMPVTFSASTATRCSRSSTQTRFPSRSSS